MEEAGIPAFLAARFGLQSSMVSAPADLVSVGPIVGIDVKQQSHELLIWPDAALTTSC
jgi:hypothetical protein